MSGLFGIRPENGARTPDSVRVRQSAFSIRHRSLDACNTVTEPGLGLAPQPFNDSMDLYSLVYSGGIRNVRFLRTKLEKLGVAFRTTSDAEVVLHSLVQWGEEALMRFEGMFALAFIDRRSHRLLLARDRFGMKPLYWAQGMTEDGPAFLFASEIKAFEPWMALQPDLDTMAGYLLGYNNPIRGSTFYQNVRSLTPGSRLWYDGSEKVDIAPFFQLTDFLDLNEMARLDNLPAAEIVDEFADLMHRSLTAHLPVDARIGAFCSDGVETSLIAAISASQHHKIPLIHVNVGSNRTGAEAARDLSKSLKLDLHIAKVEEQDVIDMIPQTMRHYEIPFASHSNGAALIKASQLAADAGITELLSGGGSDVLFNGYPLLARKYLVDGCKQRIFALMSGMRAFSGMGPLQLGRAEKANSVLNGAVITEDTLAVQRNLKALPDRFIDRGKQLMLEYMHEPLRAILHRNEAMGMSAGVETRFPFLDTRIARFGINLPTRYKLKASPFAFDKVHPFIRTKWVVREVTKRYVPHTLSRRIGSGSGATVFQRLDIRSEYFRNGQLQDLFSLTNTQMEETILSTDPDLKLRLLLAEVWLRCRLYHQDEAQETTRLHDYINILPDGYRPTCSACAKPANAVVPG
ncbi:MULTISPECIES: asparagine synthase-related protein [unclassified Ruegeria]|uniref:asparagine synthetase B family protein n=1 Tax=unclassified Ruegeria TaxID=2625375 RepID=UPI001AE92970|nr:MULTISPECIES: asparagine synthase-related protein [unclassified Ruegeria]